MSTNIYRGPLTKAIIDYLKTKLAEIDSDIPVGDGVVPKGAGWIGEPNAPGSHFQPYVVLLAGSAQFSSGPIADSQADWRFPYMLGSYHVTREGLDWMADRARSVFMTLKGATYPLGEDYYQVQFARVESIGGTNRIDQTDPPYWGQVDGLSIWMTKVF